MNRSKILSPAALALAGIVMAGCSQYVKRDEFDSTVASLRAADAEAKAELDLMQVRFGELTEDLQARFEDYNARITQLQGRLRVDMTANFDYDDATLREQDKAALDGFAEVIRVHHPNVLVTVEGFTDPAGSPEYNRRLGMKRAEAARQHLISAGGLDESKVRAVSYGEDANRQVEPGAWGEAGQANRRVALVIDHVPG